MDAERKEEIERELREEYIREQLEGDRRHRCPACGADESKFTTTHLGDGSWCTECGDCGELIDED